MTTTDVADAKAPPFTQGWAIVGFTAVLQFMSVGVGYYTFGVYLKPLAADLDSDRFLISLTLSFQTVLMAVLGPWIGRLLAERSIRMLLSTGTVLMTAGLLVSSQATSVWQLYVGYGLIMSPGLVLTSTLPASVLLANWFVRRRGTALGISQFGVTISGTVLVPIAAWLVEDYGWRTAFLTFAVATPVILLPLIWKFAVKTPEEVGLNPDGALHATVEPLDESASEWTFARALRTRDVWLIALIAGPSFMAIASVVLAMHSHITDLGFGTLQAASVVATTTLMGAVAKPLFGTLADYFDKRLVSAVSIGLQVCGVVVLLFAESLTTLSVAGFLFGLGYGGVAPLFSILLAERFGRASFARVMGAAMPLTMPFSLVALPVTTLIFEMTGSYLPAFALTLVGYAVAATALGLLRLER